MTATLAAVVSAILHAGWNGLVKATPSPRAGTLLTLTGAFIVVWCGVFAGRAIWGTPMGPVSPWVLVAGLGEVLYIWALGRALEGGQLGITYALSRGVAMLAVWPLSYGVFGVRPTLFGALGSLLVIAGIAWVRPAPGKGGLALGYTLLSGLAVGVYHTGYKGCVRTGMPFALAFAYALLVAVPLLWLVLGKRLGRDAVQVMRLTPKQIAGAALGCAGSFLLAVWALARADSGVVLGLRNSSIAFGVLIALALGERPSKRDWVGIGLFALSVFAFAHA